MSPNLLKRKKVKIPLRCEEDVVSWGQTWWVSFSNLDKKRRLKQTL